MNLRRGRERERENSFKNSLIKRRRKERKRQKFVVIFCLTQNTKGREEEEWIFEVMSKWNYTHTARLNVSAELN